MKIIKHLIEFNKLYLVWQADRDPNRLRYIVAELIRSEDVVVLKYLKNTDDFKKAKSFGFENHPAFTLEQEIHSNGVLETLMLRLPPRKRGDFPKYLELLRLPADREISGKISDFSLLAYSGAKLPGDGFSIAPYFDNLNFPFEFLIEVAGFRHVSGAPLEKIELNSAVTFEPDINNKIDPNAISILLNGQKIGYIPRVLTSQFHTWITKGNIRGSIEKKNGSFEKPVLYLFIEFTPK